jgi:chemotaxis signal transduction protein
MDEVSCLIVELSPYRYALEAMAVVTVVETTTLAAASSASAFVLGEVQVEGAAVPVIDLHRLLGQTEEPAAVAGPLVIVQGSRGRIALAPERILGTRMLAAHGSVRMHHAGGAGGEKPQGWKFITRLVSIDHALVMVLDAEALVDAVAPAAPTAEIELDLPEVAADETASERLAASLFEEARPADLVAVIRWNGRQYGVPLVQVEEFGEIATLRRLPGCPEHVRGQAVLRGDLVTVVDARTALGLPLPALQAPWTVVVIKQENESVGIVVDEVREMLTAADLQPPLAGSLRFVKSRLAYGGESLDILDLQELLLSEAVVVDQRL